MSTGKVKTRCVILSVQTFNTNINKLLDIHIYVCVGEVPLRDTHRRTEQNIAHVCHWHSRRMKESEREQKFSRTEE